MAKGVIKKMQIKKADRPVRMTTPGVLLRS
jgi:hypothetical protein